MQLPALTATHQSGLPSTYWIFSRHCLSTKVAPVYIWAFSHEGGNFKCRQTTCNFAKSKQGLSEEGRSEVAEDKQNEPYLIQDFFFNMCSLYHTVSNDRVNKLSERTLPPTASGASGHPSPPSTPCLAALKCCRLYALACVLHLHGPFSSLEQHKEWKSNSSPSHVLHFSYHMTPEANRHSRAWAPLKG